MNSKIFTKIVCGVYVVTVKKDDIINGITIAWANRVSHSPSLIMISVGKKHFSHELIKEGKVFALNILSDEQKDIAKIFGLKSGRGINKFKDIEYTTKSTGCPILKNCIGYLDCKVVSSLEAGDHTLFIGEVIEGELYNDKATLIYNPDDYF
jgi:flavin reductase (DIM6/NTAB) family NADH-FMN oxidoreductase RutF